MSYLSIGEVSRPSILESMQAFTKGINRANKATIYVVRIITHQSALLNQLKKQLPEAGYSALRVGDRKAICLCLISITYPITYDLLVALAQGFKVQPQLNKQFVNEKVMSLYGSNRTVDIAIDALMPMLIELQTIKRDKVSIYSQAANLTIHFPFVTELIVYTDIKLSGSKTILLDDIGHKPWYLYFDCTATSTNTFKILVAKKDSAVGKGYLAI